MSAPLTGKSVAAFAPSEAEARALARAGADLVIAGVAAEEGGALARDIDALFVLADLADLGSLEVAIEAARHRSGGLDGLLVVLPSADYGALRSSDQTRWRGAIDATLGAAWRALAAATPALRASGGRCALLSPEEEAGPSRAAIEALARRADREIGAKGRSALVCNAGAIDDAIAFLASTAG